MQRVNIYNDVLHLTGEWMNVDMLNRGTEDHPPPPSLSIFSFFFYGGGGGTNVPSTPSGSATAYEHDHDGPDWHYKLFNKFVINKNILSLCYCDSCLIWDRNNLFKGEVYIQHLAVLKERHERRMACLLKLNN
jgi:hypothetical protein